MFKHNLGDRAKDRISGLTGIICSRAEHLFGCARYWISPEENKDGKPSEGAWFDEDQIDVVDAGAIQRREYRVVEAEPDAPLQRAGGPTRQPASHTDSRGR